MKKFLFLALTLFIISLSGCSESNESEIVSRSDAVDITVYVTKTGECYHEENCTSLRKSKIEKTLADAVEKYRACQNCLPPIIEGE